MLNKMPPFMLSFIKLGDDSENEKLEFRLSEKEIFMPPTNSVTMKKKLEFYLMLEGNLQLQA